MADELLWRMPTGTIRMEWKTCHARVMLTLTNNPSLYSVSGLGDLTIVEGVLSIKQNPPLADRSFLTSSLLRSLWIMRPSNVKAACA